jgi:hypothetical protein
MPGALLASFHLCIFSLRVMPSSGEGGPQSSVAASLLPLACPSTGSIHSGTPEAVAAADALLGIVRMVGGCGAPNRGDTALAAALQSIAARASEAVGRAAAASAPLQLLDPTSPVASRLQALQPLIQLLLSTLKVLNLTFPPSHPLSHPPSLLTRSSVATL